nr:ATP-binding protein [Sedimenticola hydrogenitrophicus]
MRHNPSESAPWLPLALALPLLLLAIGQWRSVVAARKQLTDSHDLQEKRILSLHDEVATQRGRELFYRTILEDIPEMICRWKPDGSISYVNEHYCNYLGISADKLLSNSNLSLFHYGQMTIDGRIDPKPYLDNPVVEVEFPVTLPDGTLRWQRWVDRALFNDQGEICEFQSIGADVTEHKLVEERALRLAEENQRLARMALNIQEEERGQLARELHDELGQSLTAIRTEARTIRRLNGVHNAVIDECAGAISSVADQVYEVVSGIMQRLHPALLDDLGLIAALREMVFSRWSSQHAEVALQADLEEIGELSCKVRLTAYRIVQEALTNVAKHAQASQVQLKLRRLPTDRLELVIRDDGCGLDPERKRHGYGLLGMRERALALNGRFNLTSAPGEGLTILVELPLLELQQPGGDR